MLSEPKWVFLTATLMTMMIWAMISNFREMT
jgi:hypothetical protein